MLDKTNFTTRTDITQEQATALATVRTKLENGEYSRFAMQSICGCIGFHMGCEMGMGHVAAQIFVSENHKGTPFSPLFYPYARLEELAVLNRNGAISAITNFLNGSNTPWE
jgi:hypothetical protein